MEEDRNASGVKPLVSLIVPIYKVEPYLRMCISSIMRQTYDNIEIILVNDGSPDGCPAICREYACRDRRIQVIDKENGGLVSARKAGLLVARGEYVSYVDGDDWVDPDMVEQVLKRGNCADVIAFSCYEEYDGFSRYRGNTAAEGFYEGDALAKVCDHLIMDGAFKWGILPHLCDKLIKREILMKNQFLVNNAISFGEDAACSYPCILDASSLCVLSYAPYHYRQREESMVRERRQLKRENFSGIYKALTKVVEASDRGVRLQEQLEWYMWFILLLKRFRDLRGDMALFPFEKVREGMSVAVYGAGGFGTVIADYVRTFGGLKLVGWADRKYEGYRRAGLDVECPDKLLEWEYDILVIAILDGKTAAKARLQLKELGVDSRKIDMISRRTLRETGLPDWLKSGG